MPTLVVKTIGTAGGRDYSTLNNWIAGLAATPDLVTADIVCQAEFYNDSEFTSSTRGVLSGLTTDATHTITLTTATGQSFVDNANKLTNALIYNTINGVGLRATGGYEHEQVINVGVNYVTFSKLQMASGGSHNVSVLSLADNNLVDRCIVQHTGNGYVGNTSNVVRWRNCLLVTNGAGQISGGVNGGQKFYNCTFVSIPHITYGFTNGYGGVGLVFENCAIFNVDNATGG